MVKVLFDTNILIDLVQGVPEAQTELSNYDDAVISVISWMETCCKMTETEKSRFVKQLAAAEIKVAHTDDDIMRRTTIYRGQGVAAGAKKRIPDLMIRATADSQDRVVVTRNPGDFGGESFKVHVPYKIDSLTRAVSEVKPPLT